MARDADIIRTADICDEFGDELLVCELALNDYAGRNHFHGEARTFATYEDNQGIRELLAAGGAGKLLHDHDVLLVGVQLCRGHVRKGGRRRRRQLRYRHGRCAH